MITVSVPETLLGGVKTWMVPGRLENDRRVQLAFVARMLQ